MTTGICQTPEFASFHYSLLPCTLLDYKKKNDILKILFSSGKQQWELSAYACIGVGVKFGIELRVGGF